MRRMILSLTVAMATVTTLLVGGAGTALAAPPSCRSGYVCIFENLNYAGGRADFVGSDNNWTDNRFSNGTPINDRDSSWYNNGTPCAGCDHVRIYLGTGFRTVTLCLHYGPGSEVGYRAGANDKGSSHQWGGECRAGEPQ